MYNKFAFDISGRFFASTIGFFTFFTYLIDDNTYFHYVALISLVCAFLVMSLMFFRAKVKINNSKEVEKYKENFISLAILIVLLNGVVGCLSFFFLYNHVSFETPNIRYVILVSGFIGIVIAQVGGWALQSFLTYLMAVFLGSRQNTNIYFNLIGVAYIGYLFITLIVMLMNYLSLPYGLTLVELSSYISESRWHTFLTKLSEFLVLSMVLYGVLLIEKTTVIKACIIVLLPGMLLLFFQLFIQNILN